MTNHTHVQDTIHELNDAFREFKQENEGRLSSLEEVKDRASSLEEKMGDLGVQMDQAQSQLKKIHMDLRRPAGDLSEKREDEEEEPGERRDMVGHKAAFFDYIRKGVESGLQRLGQKSLSVGSDPEGGYGVPHAISKQIIKTLEHWSEFRKLARQVTISTDAMEMLVDKDEAGAGWVSETDPREETKTPELAKIRIPVHEMYARPRVTQKLLDDSQLNIEHWLVQKIGEKMARMENKAFLFGNGIHQPRGLLSYELRPSQNWEWGTIETFQTKADGEFHGDEGADMLITMSEALESGYRQGATWLMPRTVMTALRQMRLSKKYAGQYIWQKSLESRGPDMLLGYPVVCMDDLPPLVKGMPSTSLLFGNFKEAYQVVDRSGTRVLRDPYSAKPYVELYVTRRVGGGMVNSKAVKALSFKA
jgi:HK97 family phage major capsid protein